MTRRSYATLLVVGSVAVSGLAVTYAASRQKSRANEMPADVCKTSEIVDGVLQDRFRRRLEVFGIRRIVTDRDSDMTHARSTTPGDIARFKQADALNCDYRVFFYPTRKLSEDGLTGRPRFYRGSVEPLAARNKSMGDLNLAWATTDKPMMQAVKQTADASADALRQGIPLNKKMGDWWFVARPVKADASCISCHKAAKTGEPLGVMLYAVRRDTLPATTQASNAVSLPSNHR